MSDADLDLLMAKLAATPAQLTKADLTGARGRFDIRRPLGSGAFGDVYEARDRETGAFVALKALKSSRPDWLFRFKREFRTVADLSHPNVVRLYELFSAQDQWYLTMELVDGLPFDDHLQRAPQQLRSCFHQLAEAIATLHDADCVHCDIKPSNALVERTGRVVLLDFGLARPQREEHHTAIAGTPRYMAPERGMGGAPTEESDWYSFGVMLFEALAGRPPFVGSDDELMRLKLRGLEPWEPAPHLHAERGWCELATALLSPDSSARPRAAEVLAALSSGEVSGVHRRVAIPDPDPFVGRHRELDALEAALAASGQEAVLVTVHGPPGIGKSTLVERFCDRARSYGASVYEGRCREAETVPYKGLDGAIDMLSSDLRGRKDLDPADLLSDDAMVLPLMFPVLRRVGAFARFGAEVHVDLSPLELRRRGSEGLRALLSRLAGYDPVVIAIDDFQWATDDAARLLLELIESPAPPILVIVAFHADAPGRSAALDRVLSATAGLGIEHVDLDVRPLDRDDVAALIELHGDTVADVDVIVRETGGDPYLLARVLGADVDGASPSDELDDVFRTQLDALDGAARALLEVVALSASPLTQAAACIASGLPAWSQVVIDRLRRDKLLRTLGAGRDAPVEPYHERVREAAVGAMSSERRRAVHMRLAGYLERHSRVDPEILAHHFRSGQARGAARMWTTRAARDARRVLAFGHAIDLYREAVALCDGPAQRAELLEELSETLADAGHNAEAGRVALDAADAAVEAGDAGRAGALRARAGEHLMLSGLFAEGLELVREALADVSVVMPDAAARAVAETVNLTAELATRGIAFTVRDEAEVPEALLRRVDLELATARALAFTDVRAPWISARALRDSLEAGEITRVQRALCHFAFANVARAPDLQLVMDAIDEAERLAERARDDIGLAFAGLARGMQHVQRMEHRAALPALKGAARRFATSGGRMAREVAICRVLVGLVYGNYGVEIHAARELRERSTADAKQRGDMFILNWVRLLGSWLDLCANDADAAARNLALAREAWPNVQDDLFVATSLMHEISIELYARPESAWERICEAELTFHSLFTSLVPVPRAMFYRHWGFAAVLAYQQRRLDRNAAVDIAGRSAEVIGNLPYITSLQAVVRAHLAALAGDAGAVAAELTYAEKIWEGGEQLIPSLCCRLRRHQLLDDRDGTRATTEALVDLGIASPNRFAMLFVGPRFELTLRVTGGAEQ